MQQRIPTLVLYANGAKLPAVAIDTILRGALRFEPKRWFPATWFNHPLFNKLFGRRYEIASYLDDWMEAFQASPALEVTLCNISNMVEFTSHREALKTYPFVVILHSAAGDDLWLLQQCASWFQSRRGKLLVLIGNEYNLLPQKIAFLQQVGAEYIGSQLPLDAAQWLYAEAGPQILPAPHGLNPRVYNPPPSNSPRPVDIGFMGDKYPLYIGDVERTRIIEHFAEHGADYGLTCVIKTQRVKREAWSAFLQQTKGIIGAESGTYFLERDDHTINAVMAYCKAHPTATFEEIDEQFFRHHPRPMSGKAISSRHFEPIGTQTAQLLVEGRYNDILEADRHYISVKKDLSNIAEAVRQFNDQPYREQISTAAYEHVMSHHTLGHRVGSLVKTIWGV